jgi:hypothetical protein
MKFIGKDPALESAIDSFGAAVCRDDADAALSLAEDCAEADMVVLVRNCAAIAGAKSFSRLGLAKIGSQFILKARFSGIDATRTYLIRWRLAGAGRWRVASVEDLSDKRSPWSDIPTLAAARAQARNG